MNIDKFLGGDYLKQDDIPEPKLLTVEEVVVKKFDDPPEEKLVLHFVELDKGLVLNKTNLKTAKEVFGSSDTDHWAGKQIVLANDPNIEFAGKRVGGLRLRPSRLGLPIAEDKIPF